MIKDLKENIWFPDEDRLNIEASVQEKTSGQIETSYDTSIHFSTTPYRISFKRSMAYFKPGLPYEIQVCSFATQLTRCLIGNIKSHVLTSAI